MCNELLLHSNREGQAQPVLPHGLFWIFSGLLLSIHVFYSIRQFKRTTVQIRLNDDKVLIYRRNILLFIANVYKRKKKEKIPCLPKTFRHLTILAPKKLTRSFIYQFIYLKFPDERHSVTFLSTPCSALGSHCSDFFWFLAVFFFFCFFFVLFCFIFCCSFFFFHKKMNIV